jgi:carboxylesterase type B
MRGSFSSGVITFKGIPYTALPFGTNRLRPPTSPKILERRARCARVWPQTAASGVSARHRRAPGASAFYNGGRFARDGVVCVTINCQVGAVGSLYLGDGVANLRLLDQITALE